MNPRDSRSGSSSSERFADHDNADLYDLPPPMELWHETPAGRTFREAAAAARVLETITAGPLGPPVLDVHRGTAELLEEIEASRFIATEQLADGFPEPEVPRDMLESWLGVLLVTATVRAIYLVDETPAAQSRLRALLDGFVTAERERWAAEHAAVTGRRGRRDRKKQSRAFDDLVRSHIREAGMAWMEPVYPDGTLPRVLGPTTEAARYQRQFSESFDGRILSLGMSWRRRASNQEAISNDLRSGIDQWAIQAFMWMVRTTIASLTGRDMDARVHEASDRLLEAMAKGEQFSSFIGPVDVHELLRHPPLMPRSEIVKHRQGWPAPQQE